MRGWAAQTNRPIEPRLRSHATASADDPCPDNDQILDARAWFQVPRRFPVRTPTIGQELFQLFVGQAFGRRFYGAFLQGVAQPVCIERAHRVVVLRRHHDADDTVAPRDLDRFALHPVDQFTESGFCFV